MKAPRLHLTLPALLSLVATPAFASGGPSLVWDEKLQMLADNVSGPVAGAIAILAVAVAAIGYTVSEDRPGLKKGLAVLVGVCIAVLAPKILAALGLSGALL